VVLVVVVLGWGSGASAVPIQWTVASGGNDHWYDAVLFSSPWTVASAQAQTQTHIGIQGHLGTLTSAEENQFIWDTFSSLWGTGYGFWLGGFQTNTNSEPDGNWAWVTGEAWSWTHWAPGQPDNDNSGGAEDYLHFMRTNDSFYSQYPGYWNDHPSSSLGGYIVEFDTNPIPEPSTALLLGIGLSALTATRRRAS